MKRWIKAVMKVGLIALSLAACGTFSPRPDPSRFFTLSSLPQVEQGSLRNSTRPEKMFLGIGPIKISRLSRSTRNSCPQRAESI